MENHQIQTLNPWISMWTQPRATIRQIITSNPEHLVLVLGAIAGISQFLDRASMKSLGDRMDVSMIFLLAIAVGSIGGIASLYIGGALIKWTGKWIGGQAPAEHIRAAIAWSSVPIVWALILWVPELLLFGEELFTYETPIMDESVYLSNLFLGFALVELTIGIWSIVILMKALGEVQRFSAWKALGNVLLAWGVIVIPVLILLLGIQLL